MNFISHGIQYEYLIHRIAVLRVLLLMQSYSLRYFPRHMLWNLTSFVFVKLGVGVDYLIFWSRYTCLEVSQCRQEKAKESNFLGVVSNVQMILESGGCLQRGSRFLCLRTWNWTGIPVEQHRCLPNMGSPDMHVLVLHASRVSLASQIPTQSCAFWYYNEPWITSVTLEHLWAWTSGSLAPESSNWPQQV